MVPAALVTRLSGLLLFWSAVGGCRGGRSGVGVGDSASPFFDKAPGRIKEELGTSGCVALDLVGLFYCPSHVFVGAGIVVSGEAFGRLECILYGFLEVGYVGGGWCLVLHGRAEHEPGVLCGGIDFDEVSIFSLLCVDLRFLCEVPVAGCARIICGVDGLATNDMASGSRRIVSPGSGDPVSVGFFCSSVVAVGAFSDVDFWSCVYQHERKSGWLLDSTFGGSTPLRGPLSSGDLESMTVEASDSSLLGNEMVDDHLPRPARSAVKKHVDVGVLHKTASKINVLRQGGGRLQAGCSDRRRRGRPGGMYKDLNVIYFSSKGVLVKWNVITNCYQ
ncbi:unnamed protein product [Urochloa humidicola]